MRHSVECREVKVQPYSPTAVPTPLPPPNPATLKKTTSRQRAQLPSSSTRAFVDEILSRTHKTHAHAHIHTPHHHLTPTSRTFVTSRDHSLSSTLTVPPLPPSPLFPADGASASRLVRRCFLGRVLR